MKSAPEPLKLKFFHGLGDVLMFRNVLNLLDLPIEIYLDPRLGQSAVFHGEDAIHVVSEPSNPNDYREIKFHMEHSLPCQSGRATKPRICLEHEFGVFRPDYKIRPLPLSSLDTIETPAVHATHSFLAGLGPYVVCHFQGTALASMKNPCESFAQRSVARILSAGWNIVLINYDYIFHDSNNTNYAFVDHDRIRSTYRKLPMEVESLWTILRGASAFFGVDSGPLHLALSTTLPCTFIRNQRNFLENFYDTGLENLSVVDVADVEAIPHALIPKALDKHQHQHQSLTQRSRL